MQGWIYETKSDSSFFGRRVTIVNFFGKVIRNLFAFLHLVNKICLKRGNLVKKGEGVKKAFLANLFEK